MTWIKFAFWLFGIYTTYYAALIFWDHLRNAHRDTESDNPELSFIEETDPVKSFGDGFPASGKESAIISSGGVSLKQMFNLAREESIEYIKSVSF